MTVAARTPATAHRGSVGRVLVWALSTGTALFMLWVVFGVGKPAPSETLVIAAVRFDEYPVEEQLLAPPVTVRLCRLLRRESDALSAGIIGEARSARPGSDRGFITLHVVDASLLFATQFSAPEFGYRMTPRDETRLRECMRAARIAAEELARHQPPVEHPRDAP